ncbi:MAG: 1-deoxy-D-xylulose-5-phosphate synthase [Candidatus Avelusimicrobium sp.]|uniref:1-deoxy-D-xylulose-5-phosphate synthase n=1 Tax=Candidatus Avelusimicrobium sp. TaxID=3048833 RepID=UPI003F121683
MVLEKINSPLDVKNLSLQEMDVLAQEMRNAIIQKVNTVGGHFGPNLGIVEATIAFHYVFNSPEDKIVFDVSHQCYPHKMLTGRKEGFTDPAQYNKYTGYTAPEESVHDCFKVGHTSTSVSLAVGLAKARDLKGEKGNVLALIGDGSLSGGEAYEGLNNAAVLDSNIIILVNDNEMSIAENQGGLYENLRLLRETKGQAALNFFKSLGFDYLYVDEGNNTAKLIEAFQKVKDSPRPMVVHLHTLKGKGFEASEKNKEMFHWILPGTLDRLGQPAAPAPETYHSITTDFILKKAEQDKTVTAITPATPGAYGFTQEFRQKLGKQYVDVGIAEEHAVAYASAMAKAGARPVLAVMSSFIQRTYDQLSQDLCLNKSPVTLLIYAGGLSGADATHLGSFDMTVLGNIPNLTYLAPANKEEYLAMLEYATTQNSGPVAIRVPSGPVISTGVKDETDYAKHNRFHVEHQGKDVALLGLGGFLGLAQQASAELNKTLGVDATIINPRFITGLDEELLNALKTDHRVVITLEDGQLDGGFGEKVARYYGNSDMKVLCRGGKKEFTDRMPLEEIFTRCRLTPAQIAADVKAVLEQ